SIQPIATLRLIFSLGVQYNVFNQTRYSEAMNLNILDILEKYDLNDIASFSHKAKYFDKADWLNLSDDLDSFYSSQNLPNTHEIKTEPLVFCFPSLPFDDLPHISPHLLVADRVLLDDPLYDAIAGLAGFTAVPDVGNTAFELRKEQRLLETLRIIRFYIEAQDLIKEGKLVPFKQTSLPDISVKFQELFLKSIKKDSDLMKLACGKIGLRRFQWITLKQSINWFISKRKSQTLSKYLSKSPILTQVAFHTDQVENIAASLMSFLMCGGLQGYSTDFIRVEFALLYRKILEIATALNMKAESKEQVLLPTGFSKNIINVPSLRNIPLERILDTIIKEPTAFDTYRFSISEKLLKISAPPGSTERERQIIEITESIKKDLSGINAAYNGIRKSFHQKIGVNLVLGSFSIVTAGLSATAQNLDALAIAGSIFGGATLSKVAKDLTKEWIDHQKELSKLKERENYFIWKSQINSK
ncbi:MAG: hypothetical protein Q8K92_13555, partial [Leadbetterella sp.]|nr:hypothetical protein [Leadbetterella sp.]